MNVFLVVIVTLAGAEPWGIYSNINNATQAQEDCEALNGFIHDESVFSRTIKKITGNNSCEVWEYKLDAGRLGSAPDEIEVAPPALDPNVPPIPALD